MVIKFGCMPSGPLVVVINQNGSIKGHLFSATFGTFFWHFSCSINKVLPRYFFSLGLGGKSLSCAESHGVTPLELSRGVEHLLI